MSLFVFANFRVYASIGVLNFCLNFWFNILQWRNLCFLASKGRTCITTEVSANLFI